jgi:hypothetical protein
LLLVSDPIETGKASPPPAKPEDGDNGWPLMQPSRTIRRRRAAQGCYGWIARVGGPDNSKLINTRPAGALRPPPLKLTGDFGLLGRQLRNGFAQVVCDPDFVLLINPDALRSFKTTGLCRATPGMAYRARSIG